ncbi:ArsA family ATPase [Tenuibacillus multivorans]|uniref:Arsenite-transporting ATPase n=1 Tax=Tenuibacillus multivorans TaxID=237069 RepID=A0A1H0EKU2_9BACI|nr:ArsA family ATPase [Tenuibacillus multivorans]GEL77118.1 arsenic-transporting ATPase [Tenuibacillus multivorans]SDN82953.1 arsenite-transporting ATPase [Tenuibacillus multivorans]
MNQIQDQRVIFVGGKGGVGKSTSSAALALANAQAGYKTLIVSTDPAHNLGDIFHQKVSHEKKQLDQNLWGIEIDSTKETERYMDQVKDNLKGLVKSKMVDEVHRQIDLAAASPGADEAALFDRLISIILDEQDHFDKIIFDTAPTGHTIRLLSLPELMSVWIDGMLEKRQKINENYTQLLNDGEPVDDPIYDILQGRKEKFSSVRDIILDEAQTGFMFVLIPERLPILETKQAIKQLHQYHLHVRTLIVNKVLPNEADGEFLQKRRHIEQNYLKEIHDQFRKQRLVEIPLYEEDISDLGKLNVFAEHLEVLTKEEVK